MTAGTVPPSLSHGMSPGCRCHGQGQTGRCWQSNVTGRPRTLDERIGSRGDTANEFEKRESLQRCREIFLSLADEPFARVVDSGSSLDDVAAAIREIADGI